MSRLITVFAALCMLTSIAYAEIGKVQNATGDVRVLRADQSMIEAYPGLPLKQSDTIVTGESSSVGITFIDNSRFALGADSHLELREFVFDATTQEGSFLSYIESGTLSVSSGEIAAHDSNSMEVQTPTVILAVRGTRFLVEVQ